MAALIALLVWAPGIGGGRRVVEAIDGVVCYLAQPVAGWADCWEGVVSQHIQRSTRLPYSCRQMFALVEDIESYPEFLPFCTRACVLSRDGADVQALLELSKGRIRKAFTTRNRVVRDERIEMRLVNGPFRSLEGCWRFDPLDEAACRVSMDMRFEFSNRLIGLALGPVFNPVLNSLMDAFVRRAEQFYGHGGR